MSLMSRRLIKIFLGLGLVIILAVLIGPKSVLATSPTFLVSWKADNYAPLQYFGKIFPVNQTKITVSFEMVSNNPDDSGKLVDLSGSEVRWYVNDQIMYKENGRKTMSFVTSDSGGAETNVKISAEYFDKVLGYSSFVNRYLTIPLVSPEVVINNVGFSASLSQKTSSRIFAIPYFFNSDFKNLSVKWSINDQNVAVDPKDPWNLDLSLGSNYPARAIVKITAVVSNILEGLPSASKDFYLTVQ